MGLPALLKGVLDIFRATNSKRKYFRLIEYLESMGLVRIPMELREIMLRPGLQGANEVSQLVDITTQATDLLIMYVQPNGEGPDVISFREFAEVVCRHDDPLS